MINEVFRNAFPENYVDQLWLAETYDKIDSHCGHNFEGLRSYGSTVVNRDWQSPWAGKDLEEVVDFVRNTPKPPKALNKVYFVVLDKEQYEQKQWVTVHKIVDGGTQAIPCDASSVSMFLNLHHREAWEGILLYGWQEYGVPLGEGLGG